MKTKITVCLLLLMASLFYSHSQPQSQDSTYKRHFVSSSAFMLINLLPIEDPPRFFQLNYGYKISPKDAIILEAITWQYFAPLGIPYGSSYEDPDEFFPGIVRDIGLGVAYQRYWWKGAYTTIHATPFYQQYLSPEKVKIQSGFQLFTTLRFGYHVQLFRNRLFIEPSVAFTHWPVNTNLPESFQRLEDKWPNYFLFEPGLHIGVKF